MSVGGRGARVLIADDKEDIRTLISQRLGLDPGLEVVGEASNGAEAITKVGELQPAALILDLQMPVMSGEEAIPILRSLAPELRILVFSAYVGVEKDLSGSWRPDAEVPKGGDLRLLVREVHRVLEELPADVLQLALGALDVRAAQTAVRSWEGLAAEIRAGTPAGAATADLLALAGMFLSLGRQIGCASALGLSRAELQVATRPAAARGARRALLALPPEVSGQLEPLHRVLVDVLPV